MILPFAIVAGDDKDHQGKHDGKSISDSLTAELLRIFKVHKFKVYKKVHKDEAIALYQRAIKINAQNPLARASLAACYRRLSRDAEYAQEIKIARELPYDWKGNEYNQACFQALCGNLDEALKLLHVALEKKQQSPDYARRDIDFEFIREDPRFKALTESDNRIHSTSIV